jgi:hypothetical protein
MATTRLRPGQRSAFERATARAERGQPAGVSNRDGGLSFFHQSRGDATPTAEETAAAVKWARGADSPEMAGHQTHTWGPKFGEILPNAIDNGEMVALIVNGQRVDHDG